MRLVPTIGGLSIGLCLIHVASCGSDDPAGTRMPDPTAGSSGAAGTGANAGNAGTTFVGMGGGGGATLADSGFLDPDAACAAQKQDSKPIPTDIFIMLDKSNSMNCAVTDTACTTAGAAVPPTRWTAVTDGIRAFANTPTNAGIGVGLSFFPTNDAFLCDPQSYVKTASPITPLPAGGTAILNRIAVTQPVGKTPTVPAIQGGILNAQKYMADNPGRSAAVVLVTDGMPEGCTNNTVQFAVDAAKAGYDGTPRVETYVLGLGDVAALDEIALAGSGGLTHYVDANADPAVALRDLLKMVAHPLTCDYPVPKSTTALDFKMVDVQTRLSDTSPTVNLKYVQSVADCSAVPSWYYDVPPPGTPTKITLCPAACDPLKGSDAASVQVVVGCVARVY